MKHIEKQSKSLIFVQQDGKEVIKDVTTNELLESALLNYQEGAKGIDNILKLSRIYNKVKESKNNGSLDLEDAEFDMLFDAIEKTQWSPGIATQFPEFFNTIKKLKENAV